MGDSKVKVRIVYEWEFTMSPSAYLGESDPLKMMGVDRRVCEEDPEDFIRLFEVAPKEISFELIGKGDVETTKED